MNNQKLNTKSVNMNNYLTQKASDSLTGNGVQFAIKAFGINLNFTIKKLVLGTLIQISKEQSKIEQYSTESTTADVISSYKANCKPMARIISLAVVNSRFQPLRKHFLTWLFLKKLTSEELLKLTEIVIDSTGTAFFFKSSILLQGLEILKSQEATDTSEHTPSGEE